MRELSIIRIIFIVSFNVAINFGWNSFFNFATPLFATLGVSAFWISAATVSGPVCGFLQPFIGMWSDNCTSRWGRRRPFILGGLVLGVIGMVLFANSVPLGKAMSSDTVSIVVAASSLWITHIGFNIIQAAGCGLMLDTCRLDDELDIATAAGSALNGLAGILAAFIGFIDFVSFLPFFTSNLEAVFYAGVVLVIGTTIPTLVAGKEKPFVPQQTTTVSESLKEMFLEIRHMKNAVFRLFVLVMLTAMVQYPWSLYFTHYMAVDIYKGNHESPEGTVERERYEDGVRAGSLVTGFMDTFTLVCAIPLSPLVKVLGYKSIYMIGNLWGVVGYGFVAIPKLDSYFPAITLAVSTGLFQAVTNSLQWTLLGLCIDDSKPGVYAGILNVVQTLGELLSGFIAGLIIDYLPPSLGLGKISPGIATGGIYGVLSIPIILALVVKSKIHETIQEREEGDEENGEEDETVDDETSSFLKNDYPNQVASGKTH